MSAQKKQRLISTFMGYAPKKGTEIDYIRPKFERIRPLAATRQQEIPAPGAIAEQELGV